MFQYRGDAKSMEKPDGEIKLIAEMHTEENAVKYVMENLRVIPQPCQSLKSSNGRIYHYISPRRIRLPFGYIAARGTWINWLFYIKEAIKYLKNN